MNTEKAWVRLRNFFLLPNAILTALLKLVTFIRSSSRINNDGWDDDWSFVVFLLIFASFICFSIYF